MNLGRWSKDNRSLVEFDNSNFRVEKVKRNINKVSTRVLQYLLVTVFAAVLSYVIFSIIFRTDTERRLRREIRMMERLSPELESRIDMISDAMEGLQLRDNEIYSQIFNSLAPDIDPSGPMNLLYSNDTIRDERLLSYIQAKSDSLISVAAEVDKAFTKIFDILSDSEVVIPPMSLPLEQLSYTQVGASTGSRVDPFYGSHTMHSGLDLIVLRGTSVHATADGVVVASNSDRSTGHTVQIRHEGGYETMYAHMETRNVSKGQSVKAGQQIGTVGMSGRAFAPHLHYEILKDGKTLDPVNYFFASVSPSEYLNMLYMSANTQQCMD